jgi:hypothetical protein
MVMPLDHDDSTASTLTAMFALLTCHPRIKIETLHTSPL